MMSELHLKGLASGLIAYAEDHCENFPASISSLSEESSKQYGFQHNLYARGGYVRSFAPLDVDPSPLVAEVFSHHSFIATQDRRQLIVFERPGLWDDHTVGYIALDLQGRWKSVLNGGIEGMKVNRVTEQQFAEYISKLGMPAVEQSPADFLVTAAENGEVDKIEILLSKSVSIDDPDRRGWTPLTIATQNDRTEVVKVLIAKGARFDLRDSVGMGRTALMRASALGYATIVESLLAHGADPQAKRDDGSTALLDALPYPVIVQKLIAAGANVNEQSRKEWSLLIAASSGGYAQTVRILIEHGANLQKDGLIALDDAARNGHADVIETLLSKGISANKKAFGEALSSAYCHPEAMRQLISAGADLNARCPCPGGRTALMISALNGCPDPVNLLIAAGADLNAKDDNEHTVLDLMLASTRSEWMPRNQSEKKRLLEIIDTLREHGAVESGLKVEWPEPR